jgi:ubiquinone/menaquinone biosynthesis C-methylase UbiE
MNSFEKWFCGSRFWQKIAQQKLLPWILQTGDLGEHLLEVGAGPGGMTNALRNYAKRVTSLEYDDDLVARWNARHNENAVAMIRGDAAALPFREGTFSAVVAVLVLHHLKSREQQNRAFAEFFRVLRPGGVFLAFEIQDGWMHRIGHIKSTFVPIQAADAKALLLATGFSSTGLDCQHGGYRMRALRPE